MRRSLILLSFALSLIASSVGRAEQTAEPLSRVREGGTPDWGPDRRLTPYSVTVPQPTDVPTSCLVASPPEYSPSDGILLSYKTGNFTSVVVDLVAALTGDPLHDEIAYVVVTNAATQSTATTQFVNAGADMSKVKFIVKPQDTVWIRDFGPHFIWQGGARGIADSHYYPGRPLDNFIPTLSGDDYFHDPTYDIGLYYSGGNFQPGPNRTAYMTSLINLDNPGFGDTYITQLLNRYQGIDTLHIFPKLPFSVDGTGHIDMWFYMVDDHTVIISQFVAGSDATAITITNDAATYMAEQGWTVYRTPAKNIGSTHFTYTNAFRVNDRIFIPTYGEGSAAFLPLDAEAMATWQTAAGPGVEIVPINCWSIIPAAGAIHCIVMQVPRYTDQAPADCLNTPANGDVLVAGKSHEITWEATDNVSLSKIDVYYSTDGSNYQPVVLNLPGGRDNYVWTVPPVESDTGYVKVVATDGQSNATEAVSPSPFHFATALQHVYDFSTGAGVDKHAYGTQTSNWAGVLNGVRKPAILTELSAANYAKLAVSDATGGDTDVNRYISATPTGTWETSHVFEFTIAEDPASIVDLGIRWEGYGDDCIQMELYVWDYVTNNWSDTAGLFGENRYLDNFAANRDEDLDGHIRTDLDRYINGSGQMTLLVYGERPGQKSFHDYMAVTVTYEACLGTDTDFDGWGNACDNCASTANTNQANDDGDLRGNACDCAPLDATAFAVPTEVLGLGLTSPAELSWTSSAGTAGNGTAYDILRGDLGDWGPSGYGDTCLTSGWNDVTLDLTDAPANGAGYFYLVRGANACGVGNYGYDSAGGERTSAVCP
jgi:agmatine deiminase